MITDLYNLNNRLTREPEASAYIRTLTGKRAKYVLQIEALTIYLQENGSRVIILTSLLVRQL